jgi:hypothetical protein
VWFDREVVEVETGVACVCAWLAVAREMAVTSASIVQILGEK